MTAHPVNSHDPMSSERGAGGVVVTAAGPNMRPLLHQFALPTFALREPVGVPVAVDLAHDGTAADACAQHAKWAKVGLMRQALRAPAGAVARRRRPAAPHRRGHRAHLHPDHFQALALEYVPFEHRVNPNTGVWLMRSCPQAFAFLDAVEAAGHQPGPWADQGAVLAALGWNRGDAHYRWARPGPGSEFLAGTSWLPPGWNPPYLEGRTVDSCYNSTPQSYATRPTVPNPQPCTSWG